MLSNIICTQSQESIYNWEFKKEPTSSVTVDIQPEPVWPADVVDSLAKIEGPMDVICWYEGPSCLPKKGAAFLQKHFFEPLCSVKRDTKLFLYSLNGWNFKLKKVASSIPQTTPLGLAINRINTKAVECIYASDFFKYCCTDIDIQSPLYTFISEELPKKQWLAALSKDRAPAGMKIDQFFSQQISLLDCIKDWDAVQSYSMFQYVEGYYLIMEGVKRGLENKQQKIEIAFVFYNDEVKNYRDYPQDIEKMLEADFGESLNGIEINIRFRFFKYDPQLPEDVASWNDFTINPNSRPYLGAIKAGTCLSKKDVPAYFKYLTTIKG